MPHSLISHLWSDVLQLLEQDDNPSCVALAESIRKAINTLGQTGVAPDGFTPKAFMRILLALQEEYANRS